MTKEQEISDRELKTLNKMRQKAKKILDDHQALKALLERTHKKMEGAQNDDSLKQKMVEYLKLISRMIGNYLKGAYNDTPWQTIIMLVAGLLYFVTPLDAIPDFIPIGGLIDDATVLVWIGKCFREDIAVYKAWEEANYSEN